jgi:hypothetical protein
MGEGIVMRDRLQGHAFALEDFDYEALYQGKQPIAGVDLGWEEVPWDLGEPQPAVVALEQSGQLRSEILDAGCGLGEHAIFLAEFAALRTDERGRVRIPVWALHALRR